MDIWSKFPGLAAIALAGAVFPFSSSFALMDSDVSYAICTGGTVLVGQYGRCDGLPIEVDQEQPPSHGKIELRRVTMKVDHIHYSCSGATAMGTQIWYVSQPAFIGDEEISFVVWLSPGTRARSFHTVHIHVVAADAIPWPPNQEDLKPRPTTSLISAQLPSNVAITQPATGTPRALLPLSGIWAGWLCDPATSVSVAVETLSPTGGRLAYAVASSAKHTRQQNWRMKAFFVAPNELRAAFGKQAHIGLRHRADDAADIWWERGKRWCSGVLTRQ